MTDVEERLDYWRMGYNFKIDCEGGYKDRQVDCYGNSIVYICPECGVVEGHFGECDYCGRELEMR